MTLRRNVVVGLALARRTQPPGIWGLVGLWQGPVKQEWIDQTADGALYGCRSLMRCWSSRKAS